MALGSTWFDGTGTPDYTDVHVDPDFSSAVQTTTTSGSLIRYTYTPSGDMVFLPTKKNETTNQNRKDPELGYCYLKRQSDDVEEVARNIWHGRRYGPAISQSTGEPLHRPFDFGDSLNNGILRVLVPTAGADLCDVMLYQPDCWYGLVGQVIASVLIYKGLDIAYIDQTAFSASDDAQVAMSFLQPNARPYVFYRREIGKQVGQTLKDLVNNCWDILTVNMEGKVALMPRTSVPAGYTISGLDRSDGVVSVQWRYDYEHLANKAWASEGRYYDILFESVSGLGLVPDVVTEIAAPTVAAALRDMPFETFEAAASITKYGARELGRDADIYIENGDDMRPAKQFHLPHLCNIEGSNAGDPLAAKSVLMQRMVDVDSQLRREVTIVQDLRGLDYDVGYLVEDLAVTADGAVFDAFCIRKTIDFDDLSVTSVFLEEPA